MQKRAQLVGPATCNREFSRLRHLFKCAGDWGFIRSNPCRGVKELKEPPGRIRYLYPPEIEKLLLACEPGSLTQNPNNENRKMSELINTYLKPIVQVALHSGMRRSEILGLEWKDIDFGERRIILTKTKNNERRTIYMNDTLCSVLKSLLLLRPDTGRVFPDLSGDMVTHAFMRAVKRAGIEDFRFHDLRHTYASLMIEQGENIKYIQTQLGHSSPMVTLNVYAHLMKPTNQEAVLRLESTIFEPTGHSLGTEKEKDLSINA